jgi:hypothetical protein
MKVYCCKELKNKNKDSLLDLLSDYIILKKEINHLIEIDPNNEDFYINELLYYYELNIRKIKNELVNKTKN